MSVSEAGVRPQRIEYVRESTEGEHPDNPSYLPYSDNVTAWWDWEPDANVTVQRGAGNPDPNNFYGGAETHDATISYDLQQWFVDGSGNAQDASADAMLLDSDNSMNNTHSVVSREDHSSGGTASGGIRIYHVGKGGHPSEVTVPFETEDGTPIAVELAYQFEKFRTYKISQPSSDTTVWVQSTDSSDTSQTLTVENEGAGTTEDVSLSGTTAQQTTASFSDIDAAELDSETVGNVEVYDGDPSSGSPNLLVEIKGQDSYNHGEGDLGVPALGTGSHASALGSNYITFIDDSMPTWDGNDIAAEFISGELSVSLNLEDNSKANSPRRNIHTTGRTTTWSGTVAGESESVDQTVRYLTGEQNDIVWTSDSGSITGSNARYMSPGSSDFEPQQGKMERDVELESEGLTIA